MLSLFFLSFLKTQCVPRLGGAKLPAPLCQVRDRPPPWKPEAPGGRGAAGQGFEPRCPAEDRQGGPSDPARPAPRASPVASPRDDAYPCCDSGGESAAPRAASPVHRLRRGGEAPPSARERAPPLLTPGLCRGPGRRERAASARAHAAPSAAVPGRFRSPRRHRLARPAPTPSDAERPPLETLVLCTSRCAERWDPAGAKSRENGLGFFFRPRPLGPPRATPAPAAGARCGDVTAWARASLLQVRRATGAGSAWGARQLAGGRRFTDGCRRGSAK